MATEVLEHDHKPGDTIMTGSEAATALSVDGMSCNNCVRHVREAIETVPGVSHASVNLEGKRAIVHWKQGAPQAAESIIKAVGQAGYEARMIDPSVASAEEDHGHQSLAGWQLNLWIGVLVTIPLMLGEWVFTYAVLITVTTDAS